MEAMVGDFLVIPAEHVDGPRRIGLIQEVHGADGSPPYVVKWEEDGRTTIVFPGPDARIERLGHGATAGDRR